MLTAQLRQYYLFYGTLCKYIRRKCFSITEIHISLIPMDITRVEIRISIMEIDILMLKISVSIMDYNIYFGNENTYFYYENIRGSLLLYYFFIYNNLIILTTGQFFSPKGVVSHFFTFFGDLETSEDILCETSTHQPSLYDLLLNV